MVPAVSSSTQAQYTIIAVSGMRSSGGRFATATNSRYIVNRTEAGRTTCAGTFTSEKAAQRFIAGKEVR
jgi:hypothetical protein